MRKLLTAFEGLEKKLEAGGWGRAIVMRKFGLFGICWLRAQEREAASPRPRAGAHGDC